MAAIRLFFVSQSKRPPQLEDSFDQLLALFFQLIIQHDRFILSFKGDQPLQGSSGHRRITQESGFGKYIRCSKIRTGGPMFCLGQALKCHGITVRGYAVLVLKGLYATRRRTHFRGALISATD